MYKITCFPMGIYQANCYLIEKDGHILIIDPGAKNKSLVEYIRSNAYIVDGILLTHGHFDHIAGADFFADHFNAPIWIDEEEIDLARDKTRNCSFAKYEATILHEVSYYHTGFNRCGIFEWECIYAPGHSEGSVLLKFENHIFCGDVIFKDSIGRCDLPTGSNTKMLQTLSMIKEMNPESTLYPGHGEITTLHDELMHNPYLI